MNTLPSVAVVIPNWNGAQHLPDCLDSLGALDYPRDRLELIVVDNGSTDSSRALIEESYPAARVVALSENLGFAAACNAGAHATATDCVAFLNNDMRVETDWLRALVAGYDPAAGYVCVGGVILDWEGDRIGFTHGWVNFVGHAGQDHYFEPFDERLIEDGADLPFACGGSMLIGRDVFLDLGGFDPAYFALFEDVDLGWRLWLTGYKVRLAGAARTRHRHHATAERIPLYRRTLLTERNALFTLIKNAEDENLAWLLTSALMLLVNRSLLLAGSSRESFAFDAADDAPTETVARMGLAPLHAVSDVVAELPQVLERRRDIQRRRRRADSEIFALFNRPFAPLMQDETYLEASLIVRTAFGLDRLFTAQRSTRVLVVANGKSERLREVAREAAALTDVATVVPGSGEDVLEELLAESDLVIAAGDTPHAKTIAACTTGLLVVDIDNGETSVHPEFVERADVVLASSTNASLPPDVRARRIEFSPDALRELIQEPWRWRRPTGDAERIVVPEDLQELLRAWRERYRRGGIVSRAARAARRVLPTPVERSLRRFLRRPELTG